MYPTCECQPSCRPKVWRRRLRHARLFRIEYPAEPTRNSYRLAAIVNSPAPTPSSTPTQNERDEIAEQYFDSLKFDPYPVQEDALLAWFTQEQGILVCAPTGTGKTLIAEAALFEALKLGKRAYFTTPLIALTDQKFRELQETVVRWGYSADDVGLVTGNRSVNPQAPILVVVAEILLNRLLDSQSFNFDDVWAVVMDEFHSFNLPERGIVWEFGLGAAAVAREDDVVVGYGWQLDGVYAMAQPSSSSQSKTDRGHRTYRPAAI